jgi:drug/metabolite transporter (DMT)-like permease
MAEAPRTDLLRGNLITAGSVAVWASAFPATDHLLLTWDPILLVPMRLGVGALVLTLLSILIGRAAEFRRARLNDIVLIGGLGGFSVILFIVGQSLSDGVTASVIATSGPVAALLISAWKGVARPSAFGLLGVALAVAGGALASLAGTEQAGAFRGGEFLVLAAVIIWTWYSHAAVHRFTGIGDITRSALLLGTGALVALLVAAVGLATGLSPARADFSPVTVAWLLWVGGVAVGLSLPPWFLGVRLLGITVASMHQNLAPAYVMLMTLALGASVNLSQVAGALLVVLGAAIAQHRGRG